MNGLSDAEKRAGIKREVALLHDAEARAGRRFEFGKNWRRFLEEIDDAKIAVARDSMVKWLGTSSLQGQTFLDVGSGSGLFSLAARQLGARVASFDFDPDSVACALSLRERFDGDRGLWTIGHGSVLDPVFLRSLGRFDIVYAWGVLHHTGHMWEAIDSVAGLVNDGGRLWIALYNDQGRASRRWLAVKHTYNRVPVPLRWPILGLATLRLWGPTILRDSLRGDPLATYRRYQVVSRGMSPWRDIVDWVGGLPFEVARPEEVFRFLQQRGFLLLDLLTCAGGHGCNEFLFTKTGADRARSITAIA